MAKLQMTVMEALKWIELGLRNGNVEAAFAILETLIQQLEGKEITVTDQKQGEGNA